MGKKEPYEYLIQSINKFKAIAFKPTIHNYVIVNTKENTQTLSGKNVYTN